jgi:hypothetical protein
MKTVGAKIYSSDMTGTGVIVGGQVKHRRHLCGLASQFYPIPITKKAIIVVIAFGGIYAERKKLN